MATKLTKLRITRVDCVDKGANQAAHILLWKRKEPPMAETVAKADHDAVLTQLEEAKMQIATLTEQVKKLTPREPEDLWKGVSPELRKRFEEQEARAKRAEEAVELEKAEREKVLYIAKARSYKYLPVNPDDDWEVFKSLATLPAPVQTRLDTLFKAAEEFGRLAGLTRTFGRDGVPTGGDAPLDQLTTLARSYVAKGLEQSESDGMTRAIRERPDLYEAHRQGVQREGR